IRLVVLAVERDEIVQSEPIMAGDEIDALFGFAILMCIDVGTSREPTGHRADSTVVALEKSSDIVTKPAVPFLPTVSDEISDLVKTGRVPCLGDQLYVGENRIGLDVPENRRRLHRATALVARQDRCEIEAKPVDMHLAYPVAQAVEDQPSYDGFVGIERIAAACVVGI